MNTYYDADKIMEKDNWNTLLQYRKALLKTPQDALNLSPLVSKSWEYCRRHSIDPIHPNLPKLSSVETHRFLTKYETLIEVAKPLINNYSQIAHGGFELELISTQGVTLVHKGTNNVHSFIGPMLFDENTMGTNAHSLSFRLHQPVQLFGPEHYCSELKNIIASAAPIVDENGQTIASLVLTQPLLTDSEYDDNYQQLLLNTLAMLSSLAGTVEAQIILRNSNRNLAEHNDALADINYQLSMAFSTIDAAIAATDESMVIVDDDSMIIHMNDEAAHLLHLDPHDGEKHSFYDFLRPNSQLMKLAQKKRPVQFKEIFLIKEKAIEFFISLRPVQDPYTSQLKFAAICFAPVDSATISVNRSLRDTKFSFNDILGESDTIKKAIGQAKRFAQVDENILLVGESGTGKELFAQAIHNQSRPSRPFIAINCAAMPHELIESELFGYEGGSFTGAEKNGQQGKIEMANGGTLFLDEIGDMPLDLQAVLLRVLEDKRVMRIGGKRYKQVDFRLIAATNRDLEAMVKEGIFRQDLYYRLSVLSIFIPSLAERQGDIPLLARELMEKYCCQLGIATKKIARDVQRVLDDYNWPGNVRQLQNTIHYAVNNSDNAEIQVQDLPSNIILASKPVKIANLPGCNGSIEENLSLQKIEDAAIDLAMEYAQNSVPKAAELLGISKATLYRKLARLEKFID